MKTQEVILRAYAKKITWWPAAEIVGITDRQIRWRERYEELGYDDYLIGGAGSRVRNGCRADGGAAPELVWGEVF